MEKKKNLRKGHYVYPIKKSDKDCDKLLEYAVKLFLNREMKENKTEIQCLLVEYFVNKNNLSQINISLKPLKRYSMLGLADNIEISFNKRLFKQKNFLLSAEVLFHECEHVLTKEYNNSIENDLRKKQIYFASDKNLTMYLTSPDEYKSRLAGIEYLRIFINKMEEVINRDEYYRTERNFKLLEKFKEKTNKKEEKIIKNHQKFQAKKESEKYKKIAKIKAEKSFKKLKKYKNKKALHENAINKSKRYILDYLNSFKDKDFLEKALKYCKDNESLMVKPLLRTLSFEYDERDCDKLLFTFKNNYLKNMISGESLAKHSLFYFGKLPKECEECQKQGVEKVKNLLKDFQFKGIPVKMVVVKGQGMRYRIKIKGNFVYFNTSEQAYLEASKYFNSYDLDNLDEFAIQKLKITFGQDIILPNQPQQQASKPKDKKITKKIEKEIEGEIEI